MSVQAASSPAPRGRQGILALFGDVRSGEGATTALLALNAFLLLAAYYLIKPLRESLIVGKAGPALKSYCSAAQAMLLLVLVPAYGRLASRVDRVRLITWVTLFFAVDLAIFYALVQVLHGNGIGIAFFIWIGIFNLMIVAQFWGFANDVHTPEQGKRLFATIALGSSLGAICGPLVHDPLVQRLGLTSPLLVTGAILLLCLLLTRAVHRRARAAYDLRGQRVREDAPLGPEGGFQLVWKHRYLLFIALLLFLLNAVNTNGEFILRKVVQAAAAATSAGSLSGDAGVKAQRIFIDHFNNQYYFYTNLLGVLIQVLLVSRVFKWIGVRGAIFILPCIALGGYGLIGAASAVGLFNLVRGVKVTENALDYSLNNTARHALFLPTSREAKYKAKAAIDSFFWRMGDLASAGFVLVGGQLAWGIRSFAWANFVMVLLWLWVALRLARENRKLERDQAEPAAAAAS